MSELPYDKTNPQSIEQYAKKLIGCTFLDVLEKSQVIDATPEELIEEYGNARRKGALGNLLEETYFQYQINNESEADFKDAGVELKVSPIEYTRKNELRAGERLVLSMINYNGPIETNLYESHLWKKCRLMLLIYYWRNKELKSNLLYPIQYVTLFTPTKADLVIIENDYKIIVEKIINGKAEQLSEADTFYLGACTKGATSAKSIVSQYYPPHTLARKRAFCFKNSYMTYVLNEYIASGIQTYEPLIKDVNDLQGKSFTEYIIGKINSFCGKTDVDLCHMFDREYNNNKSQWSDLAYRMLGIKSNKAEEFRKANVAVKAIRIEENGKMTESMSFSPFKYKEIVNETWENSSLHNYFEETKFLFVVFKRRGDCYALKGCKLWNMPPDDLDNYVKSCWEKVVNTIKNGVKLTFKQTKKGIIVENNFPHKKDNPIVHVRTHAQKTYYEFPDGTIIGSGTRSDANQLLDGTWMTNYSFWINNSYIVNQLEDNLIN